MAHTKVFKSGNSSAVRLPAAFKAEPGTVVEVREAMGKWIVERVEEKPRTIDLTGIWGSCRGLKLLASEDREFAERPSAAEERARLTALRRERDAH